ncbi:MAG: ATP-binding protein [Phycisphaerae bacterium]|nr:ATP-binding protein [Phycisphaerae bacterium]
MRTDKPKTRVRHRGRRTSTFVGGLSLKHKLIAVTMLTCITALALAGGIFIAWEWVSLRHAMVRDVTAEAKVIAENCRAAITFKDRADASAVLQTLSTLPSIMGACTRSEDERLFAFYIRKGVDSTRILHDLKRDGAVFSRECLTVQVPVTLDGQWIGTVTLFSDLEPLYMRLRHGIVVILGVVLTSLMAAYLISSRLQRIISLPILHLAQVARLVSEKKEYTLRAKPVGGDEVGLLIQAFNGMLEQIQQRDAALVDANDQLEVRVRERTAELLTANEKLIGEVTARRKTEQALAAANEQLAETVQNLRRSNKELQDFAHVAAHDLKAPLRGIGTLADWIASDYADRFDDQGRQQLQLLKGRVVRLTELIDGILRYSEIGRVTNRREVVDLGRLVSETIVLLDPPAHIQVMVPSPLPVVVCEKVRLGQVFHNLISNAIKYMDKPQGRIEIQCADQGHVWQFAVSDNGCGIEARHFEKVFQMFQTLVPRDQRESTGIGLSIVKKIVELFGGRIWIESKPGEGTTFFFTLPKQGIVADKQALVADEVCLN